MRINKVYTRTGDQGTTRLVMGREVSKDDPRIEAYGTIDEVNAILGMVLAFQARDNLDDEPSRALRHMLRTIQDDLFNVGTELATRAADQWEGMYHPGDGEVERLERWIDLLNRDIPPLEEFVLPSGGVVGATLHQARTVARRAERRLVSLMAVEEDVSMAVLRYLNRLSDFLFVASRYAAHAAGEPETFWQNPSKAPSPS